MVTPYHKARLVYRCEPCARTIEEDMEWHLRCGWVISTTRLFLMARRVHSAWPITRLREPWQVHPEGDAIWFWLLAGDIGRTSEVTTWPDGIRFIGYERGNMPRWFPREKFVAKIDRVPPCSKWIALADLTSNQD